MQKLTQSLYVQVKGKLLMATTGGSAQKPSAIALLEVDSVDDLLKTEPEHWQTIRLSTQSEVCAAFFHKLLPSYMSMHCSTSLPQSSAVLHA